MAGKDFEDGIQIITQDISPLDNIHPATPEPVIHILDTFHHITEADLEDPQKVLDLIKLIDQSRDEVLEDGQLDDKAALQLMDIGGAELGPKFVITAETNKYASDEFCRRVRINMHDIPPIYSQVAANEEIGWDKIWHLSMRWNLPLILIKMGSNQHQGHYTLALKNPEMTSHGIWRVLIYDPLTQGESWHVLPNNWQQSDVSGSSVLKNDFASGSQEYDLTVPGDFQTAENATLIESKRQKIQFDSYNCGLYCLFAAAIRMGLKGDDTTEFNMFGRPEIEADTKIVEDDQPLRGIQIRTRSQLDR